MNLNTAYKAFLVQIDADGALLADHFKYPEAQSAMIGAIEDRITNRQLDDPGDGVAMLAEMRQMTGWKPNTNILRAVVGRGGKPLFSWNPSTNS